MLHQSLSFRIAGAAALAFTLPFLPTQAQEDPVKNPAPEAVADLGPVETFEAWRDTLSEGRFGDTFALFPKRYQKDINALSTKFANKMDADLWEGIVGIIKSVSNILRTQKEVVSGSKFYQQADENVQAQVMENWDNAAEMTAAFSKSDVLNLEVWKNGDVGEVLNGPVSTFMEGLAKMEIPGQDGIDDAMAKLKGAEAELVSEDGNSAVLRVTGPDGEVNESEIVRVQGRWIPADMADQWDDQMAEASDALDKMNLDTPEFQQQKMMVMMGFGVAQQMLKQLEEAKSSEEFDRTVEAMMKLVGGAIPNQQ